MRGNSDCDKHHCRLPQPRVPLNYAVCAENPEAVQSLYVRAMVAHKEPIRAYKPAAYRLFGCARKIFVFLAERCNSLTKFSKCHNMSSV